VYTAAASLNPTYTYIFAHKIFHFKELGAEWRKILNVILKGGWYRLPRIRQWRRVA
jgi:hypothetical protein